MAMPSSQLFKGKGVKKDLVLELSQGEDVFECIRQGMMQQKIKEANVKAIEGVLSKASINYMSGSRYIFDELSGVSVLKTHGKYELRGKNNDVLYGNLHVVVKLAGKPVSATLTKATASEGLKIRLQFVEVEEKK
ncbi:MAG: DUF296 domain-containing protein [Candidatus Diapherotrites archaeon]